MKNKQDRNGAVRLDGKPAIPAAESTEIPVNAEDRPGQSSGDSPNGSEFASIAETLEAYSSEAEKLEASRKYLEEH